MTITKPTDTKAVYITDNADDQLTEIRYWKGGEQTATLLHDNLVDAFVDYLKRTGQSADVARMLTEN